MGLEILRVPYENFHFVVTKTKSGFKLDFNAPIIWIIGGMVGAAAVFSLIYTIILRRGTISIGGAIPALFGFIIVKAIFKSKKKEKIEQFNNSFIDIVNGIGKDTSTQSV